uniref:Uncharacterized protein n=1 Tax=Arundo donax TaxID=35708 RepID=A0A0A9HUJ7_ARUDO
MCNSGTEMIAKILEMEQKLQYKIMVSLWRWRPARNKANAGESMASTEEVCLSVTFHLIDFEKHFVQPIKPAVGVYSDGHHQMIVIS